MRTCRPQKQQDNKKQTSNCHKDPASITFAIGVLMIVFSPWVLSGKLLSFMLFMGIVLSSLTYEFVNTQPDECAEETAN